VTAEGLDPGLVYFYALALVLLVVLIILVFWR
jgi:hypothetical protein